MSEAIRQMFRENVVAVRRFRSALAAAYSYEVFKLNGRTVLQVAHAARARQHAAVVAGSCALVLRQLGKDDVDIDV